MTRLYRWCPRELSEGATVDAVMHAKCYSTSCASHKRVWISRLVVDDLEKAEFSNGRRALRRSLWLDSTSSPGPLQN
jgi:hypothetical protein